MGSCAPRCSTCSAESITYCMAATWDREAILEELQAIAPLTAVYGNTDGWALRNRLPRVARVELDGFTIIVTHGDQLGSPTPDRLQAEFPRRGNHRLRPHPPAGAHAGGHGGDRDESGRRGTSTVRSSCVGRNPGAQARHPALAAASCRSRLPTRTSLRLFSSPPPWPRSRVPQLRLTTAIPSPSGTYPPLRPPRRGSTPSGGAPLR